MSRQPEGKLVESIKAYLRGRGAFVFKVHAGEDSFQEVGLPDLIVCWRGHFLGLEVKLPGQKPSPRQRHILRQISEAQGIAAVVHSVEEVEKILRQTARERG
jgi:hypothetical protein